VFYYLVSKGKHPFGERVSRESNILKGQYALNDIESILVKERKFEVTNLIEQMISY
jgi:serine/threonine-protein kinase/endoribonuclease IRE1